MQCTCSARGSDMQSTWSMEWTCSGHAVHMWLTERPVGQVGDMADAERDACGELGAPDVAHARDGREHAHGQADEEGVAPLDAAEGRRAVRLVRWQLQLGGRAACTDARRRGMRRLSGRSSEARRGAARRHRMRHRRASRPTQKFREGRRVTPRFLDGPCLATAPVSNLGEVGFRRRSRAQRRSPLVVRGRLPESAC